MFKTQLLLSELRWQFIRELIERSSSPGEVSALKEPLSSKHVAQIASGIKEVLTWEYVPKQLDSIWSSPTKSLVKKHEENNFRSFNLKNFIS